MQQQIVKALSVRIHPPFGEKHTGPLEMVVAAAAAAVVEFGT